MHIASEIDANFWRHTVEEMQSSCGDSAISVDNRHKCLFPKSRRLSKDEPLIDEMEVVGISRKRKRSPDRSMVGSCKSSKEENSVSPVYVHLN